MRDQLHFTPTETPEARDDRLYAEARRQGLNCAWSTDGEALVLSNTQRPRRHRVAFNHHSGRAIACMCPATTRCKHQVVAERSWARRAQAEGRRARAAEISTQLARSLGRSA
jgi:hypothetical protein